MHHHCITRRCAYTDTDEELNAAFIDYFAQLVFPGRPLALASKHNRFINHPISTFLINRNIETIVVVSEVVHCLH